MKEIELINKRKPREKHFLREDGTIIAKIYGDDIHYKKNGKYEEIDNTLIKKNDYYCNTSNSYQVFFKEQGKDSLMKMSKDDNYLDIRLKESNDTRINKKRKITKYVEDISYDNVLEGINIEYKTLPTKVKETIVLNNNNLTKLTFIIDTNLSLIEDNYSILAKKDEEIIFVIEKPYMVDDNGRVNNNILYDLKNQNNYYELDLILDEKWLNSKDTKYPIYIDPTITNNSQSSGLYDTYIYPGDTGVDRNSSSFLKAGVERVNGVDRVNRALIKFDLPTIGTASEVVGAYLTLIGKLPEKEGSTNNNKLVTMHRITMDWTETGASWSQMHDKYDSRVESIHYGKRSFLNGSLLVPSSLYSGDITDLVKRWYRDTPNYGLLLKSAKEVYQDENYPAFFSKNNTSNPDLMPMLQIVYRNQNGLENYLNYKSQNFTNGSTNINTFNGNLIGVWNIGSTIGGKLPARVSLVYNTNDVVLNNTTTYGRGYKLSLSQTITDITISDKDYLEYSDEDGTIHYFYKDDSVTPNIYRDEDGLELTIEKDGSTYIMSDKNGNKKTFSQRGDKYYLIKIQDVSENVISIELDSDNNITKVIDANNQEIGFTYQDNLIKIISPDAVVDLGYTNGLLTSIKTVDGITSITYDNNNLISTITDVTGIKINYEYYSNIPYRAKKVTQYGLNNTIGNYFSLEYGFNTTSITDHKGRTNTLIFNSWGNLLSSNSLNSSEDLNSAYSTTQTYGDDISNKNKLLSDSIPVKYVKNYLTNTSFEQGSDNFIAEAGITKIISSEYAFSGYKSLKLVSSDTDQSVEQSIQVSKGNNYTFSGYFKNDKEINISLSYTDNDGNIVEKIQAVESGEDFSKEDVTIYYDTNATSDLKIKITLKDATTAYMDDVQLEEGEVANSYNVIENSDFSSGLSDWTLEAIELDGGASVSTEGLFEVVNFNNNQNKALKVNMNPLYSTRFSKEFPIKGKKGDIYNISFWYKNEGIQGDGNVVGNSVMIYFKPVGGDADYCILPSDEFNPNGNIWQYFTFRYGADEDYESIKLIFNQGREANSLYITNLTFYKDLANNYYNYDDNGNVTSIKESSKDNSNTFGYDNNNQLISATTPKGKNFKFEYDNIKTDRLLNSISSMGINNQVKYDLFGNPILTRISKKGSEELITGAYKIRSKGTEKYLKVESNKILVESDSCSNTIWNLQKIDEDFKIMHSILSTSSITYLDDNVFLSNSDENNLFNLEKNENGSYYIKIKLMVEEGSNSINEQEKEGGPTTLVTKALRVSNGALECTDLIYNDPSFEFYFETQEEEFIETSATYSEDGRFVTSVTDSNFNETIYQTDSVTGLVTSIVNANGNTTNYQYNTKKQIASVTQGDKTIAYSYNDSNLLSKITQGAKEYNFIYDNFLNAKKVMIGNTITLATNEYEENNGNLSKTIYGNNHEISFDYDCFDRVKTIYKMDDNYHYKYDNNGNVAKILSDSHTIKYIRDTSQRIHEYRYDNFKANYSYDSNDNITGKRYRLANTSHFVENTFNKDDLLTKSILDNQTINYQYDGLGRIINKNINSNYNTNYDYVSNGKRTSSLIKSVKNGNNKYSYEYDNLNNITHIYCNDELIRKYCYDVYNELIEEENYEKNEKTTYTYDNSGNLTTEVTKDLTTGATINIDTYQYENIYWEDQLTKVNNQQIAYDEIGNPLTIGSNITMSWINGRSLNAYTDTSKNLNISYKYNNDGIRISKTINGVETRYFLEGNHIIYEQQGNNIIYYLYDAEGVTGVLYNGDIFYFIKNLQGDIIGILNNNYEQVVSYEYDSWGKVLSIKDASGIEITDTTNIGIINPFRYRGYYYDKETDLYYLNSRYYNPTWRRFVNADEVLGANRDILSYNLYAYVSNNPIVLSDFEGHGLFKKISNVFRLIKTSFNIVKNKVEKAITSAIGSIISVEYNYLHTTSQRTESIGVGSYETGSSTSYSTTIFGKSNSFIKISINNYDNDFSSSTIGIGVNSPVINSKMEVGAKLYEQSIGVIVNENLYNINTGRNILDSYTGFSEDDTILDGVTNSYYVRFNINMLTPIIIYGILNGQCTSPQQYIPIFSN